MKRQTVTKVVTLLLLSAFLLSMAGCGRTITSLDKIVFQKKVEQMGPDEIIKWLGKPSTVKNDNGSAAEWHWQNACVDNTTGKKCDVQINVVYRAEHHPRILYCGFSSR